MVKSITSSGQLLYLYDFPLLLYFFGVKKTVFIPNKSTCEPPTRMPGLAVFRQKTNKHTKGITLSLLMCVMKPFFRNILTDIPRQMKRSYLTFVKLFSKNNLKWVIAYLHCCEYMSSAILRALILICVSSRFPYHNGNKEPLRLDFDTCMSRPITILGIIKAIFFSFLFLAQPGNMIQPLSWLSMQHKNRYRYFSVAKNLCIVIFR